MTEEEPLPVTTDDNREFRVTNWSALQRDTLRAFLTLTLPSGLILNNCSFHEKSTERWVTLPAKPFSKGDGSTGYDRFVEFATPEARQRFQAAAIKAIDRFREAQVDKPSC